MDLKAQAGPTSGSRASALHTQPTTPHQRGIVSYWSFATFNNRLEHLGYELGQCKRKPGYD